MNQLQFVNKTTLHQETKFDDRRRCKQVLKTDQINRFTANQLTNRGGVRLTNRQI